MLGFAIGLCCIGREGRQLARWKTGHSIPDTAVLWSLCIGSILTDGSQFKIARAQLEVL